MKKLSMAFEVLFALVHPTLSFGVPMQHTDIHTLSVPGSIIPPVLGGDWSVTSLLNIRTAEPHVGPVGAKVPFKSINIFSATADSFTPLFVPGDPLGFPPPGPGANLADIGVYEVDLTLTGPAVFDYTMPWTVRVEDNRKLPIVEFSFSLNIAPTLTIGPVSGSLGGAGVNVNFKPAVAGPTLFETLSLPQDFNILLSPTAAAGGQGFFASAGRIVVDGFLRDTGVGTSRLLYDNVHWATGEGILVEDFTRALGAGFVRTEVFDDLTSVVPEPATLLLLGLGLAWVGGIAWSRRRQK